MVMLSKNIKSKTLYKEARERSRKNSIRVGTVSHLQSLDDE